MFSQTRQRTVRSFRLSTIGAAAALIVGGALTVTTAFAGIKDHSGASGSGMGKYDIHALSPACSGAIPADALVNFEGVWLQP